MFTNNLNVFSTTYFRSAEFTLKAGRKRPSSIAITGIALHELLSNRSLIYIMIVGVLGYHIAQENLAKTVTLVIEGFLSYFTF